MSKKSKIFIVSWQVFPYDVMVCLGSKYEDIIKRIGKTGYKLNQEELEAIKVNGNGRTILLRGGQCILWIPDYPKLGSGILAHEIFHSVSLMLGNAGIRLSNDSDEIYAYAIAYLTEQINGEL